MRKQLAMPCSPAAANARPAGRDLLWVHGYKHSVVQLPQTQHYQHLKQLLQNILPPTLPNRSQHASHDDASPKPRHRHRPRCNQVATPRNIHLQRTPVQTPTPWRSTYARRSTHRNSPEARRTATPPLVPKASPQLAGSDEFPPSETQNRWDPGRSSSRNIRIGAQSKARCSRTQKQDHTPRKSPHTSRARHLTPSCLRSRVP